jgi:hypothetical protein
MVLAIISQIGFSLPAHFLCNFIFFESYPIVRSLGSNTLHLFYVVVWDF